MADPQMKKEQKKEDMLKPESPLIRLRNPKGIYPKAIR